MKHYFQKISIITLALLVLFSTFSFTVDTHYCGDFLVDISINGDAEGCGMKMDMTSNVKKKNCCKDEIFKIDGQKELQVQTSDQFTCKHQYFLKAFIVTPIDSYKENKSTLHFFNNFSPPDIPMDYQVYYQTFLI